MVAHDESAARLRVQLETLGLDVSAFDEIGDDFSTIALPTLNYGFAASPFTWEQLQHIILVEKDLAKLSRSLDQQREYEIFRYFLKKQYQSVLDYILIAKFDFEKKWHPQEHDGRWQAHPPLKEYTETRTVLIPNDFPYCIAEDIVHYILWKTKEAVTPQDIEKAKQELKLKMRVIDAVHWINPPHLQSLPDIDHAHILCRLETTPRNET